MTMTMTEKILKSHLLEGEMISGAEIGIKIDQTLTQDATGTMAYLEFEAMGIPRVKTEKSVAYIDHNTLQSGFMNADDHLFISSIAKKHGIYYSRPGNGICHQVHLERFAKPSKTLIGSDSHTPTAGGIGCLAMGAGGLDVAVAMGGGAYYITMPKLVFINLKGKLNPWVSAKDVILAVLKLLTVKGGVGKVIEYGGEGVASLSVPERATITNMGAELGATTSIFPSDDVTKEFLKAQGREEDYIELSSDPDSKYDETYTIDLSTLTPMVACPHSPDNVKPVDEVGGIKVNQVCIGSCTNSSLQDMLKVAHILKGKTCHPDVSLVVAPGSKQVLQMLSENGALSDIISFGARVLESACGPCIGMGMSPNSNGVSLRTFNRNFEGRSGTADGQIYLVSPEVAAISAITGTLSNPASLCGDMPKYEMPAQFLINDNMVTPPASEEESKNVEIIRGPNIKLFPVAKPLENTITCDTVLKVGDNITTDHIMPAGAKVLPYRSNIPHLSQFCFEVCDTEFPKRAKDAGKGIIVGGSNYGQGSSREHAALVPLYLGIKAIVVKSFARIHRSNLINSGILPLEFVNESDFDKIAQGDTLSLEDIRTIIEEGEPIILKNITQGVDIPVKCELSQRSRDMILAGGLLNYTKLQLN